jgi:hypothetical protein
MTRTYAQQKAALTRALKAPEGVRREKVVRETIRVVEEWNTPGSQGGWGGQWPDDWSRWERALNDVGEYTPMEDLF